MPGNFHPLVFDQAINAKQRVDYVSATRILYGFAAPGTAEEAGGWCLRQETLDANGRTTRVDFANGTLEYSVLQTWSARLSYLYS